MLSSFPASPRCNCNANSAPYTMAKVAGEALALALAKEELRNGVRVNIVAPGLTIGDMGERLAQAITGNPDIHHLDAKALRPGVDPSDVAAAVLWFVSDANPGSRRAQHRRRRAGDFPISPSRHCEQRSHVAIK